MKKSIIILVILAIVLGGGYFFYRKGVKQAKAPGQNTQDLNQKDEKQSPVSNGTTSNPQNLNVASTTPNNSQTSGLSQGIFSSGSEGDMGPDILVTQVNFDGSSFLPASVNIKVGDIVVFKNNSQEDFWPASNPHPVHTDYPEFDAKQSIAPGGKYQFKFTKIGNWGYHNHLNSSIGGVVNVSN